MRAVPSLLATPLTIRKPDLLESLMYAAMVNGLRSRRVVNVVPSARTCVIVAQAITALAGAVGQSEVMPGGPSGEPVEASTYAMSPRPRILEQPQASNAAQAASTCDERMTRDHHTRRSHAPKHEPRNHRWNEDRSTREWWAERGIDVIEVVMGRP